FPRTARPQSAALFPYTTLFRSALAAYNAGPHRVEAWTATRPDVSAEEFVETIPFTETRGYVMSILSMTERYRDIYGLSAPAAATDRKSTRLNSSHAQISDAAVC